MTKKEAWLTKIAFLMTGIVIGFLLAPIKAGTYVTFGDSNQINNKPKKKSQGETE